MGELKEYLILLERVKKDEALMKLIDEYDADAARLNELLKNPDYDAAEAIRLTNDIEYLTLVIERHPLYQSYAAAKAAMEKAVDNRIKHTNLPDCQCAMCQEKRSKRRKYEEEV